MRAWARQFDEFGDYSWVAVQTDASGNDDAVRLTQLIQCLKLNLGESPIFATYGIPAIPSVMTQVFPDFYVYQTQSQFQQYFISLTVKKLRSATPTYNITVVTHSGAVIEANVPV